MDKGELVIAIDAYLWNNKHKYAPIKWNELTKKQLERIWELCE